MKAKKTSWRLFLQRTGYLALACGFTLASGLYAQNYSSSSSSAGEYGSGQSNGQYSYNNRYNGNQKPRYTGHSWTDHLVLEGGGGVTAPAGNTQNYANTGFNILLGGGYKFNDRLSVLAEWNFNRMGVPSSLANVIAGTPGGNEHIWTVDLNPKYNFVHTDRLNGYVIGGGGFSRALTNFTVPVVVPCGYGYGYYGYGYGGCSGNVTVAHTSVNQGNLDIGGGAEFRLSPYHRYKLFVEARYEKLYSPNRGALPPGYHAGLVPVTLGVRW